MTVMSIPTARRIITNAPIDDVNSSRHGAHPVHVADEFLYQLWCAPLGPVRVELHLSNAWVVAGDTLYIEGKLAYNQ
jgi:hypothetical protein